MVTDTTNTTDTLTGLLNRKSFNELFDEALGKHKASEAPLSLAFIDIDHFLQINETHGHPAGDAVLAAVAAILRQGAGEQAAVCRYGGDEFAILFPETERELAFLLVEKMRAAMAERPIATGQEAERIQGISISAGIACAPIDGRLKSELFRKADQALYRAKATGRAKVRLAYDERMVPKTSHYTQTQLERLSKLSAERQAGEAELLREALDDLIAKYGVNEIER
ncbi:MAG TPA: GGDEF domain-containing protein [Longilinea sp.]|nr:GGDEF domain-containing protein [Longilinea sp.]